LCVGEVAARAVYEELGVRWDEAELADATRTVAVFSADGDVGVLFHIRGEDLGWSGEMVLTSHRTAPDRWEGDPYISEFSCEALLRLGEMEEWTAWSLPSLLHLASER
jgi:hypothetical protein